MRPPLTLLALLVVVAGAPSFACPETPTAMAVAGMGHARMVGLFRHAGVASLGALGGVLMLTLDGSEDAAGGRGRAVGTGAHSDSPGCPLGHTQIAPRTCTLKARAALPRKTLKNGGVYECFYPPAAGAAPSIANRLMADATVAVWTTISEELGCERNAEGILSNSQGVGFTLASCKARCVAVAACKAIDFFVSTGRCSTFPRPCERPQQWTDAPSSYRLARGGDLGSLRSTYTEGAAAVPPGSVVRRDGHRLPLRQPRGSLGTNGVRKTDVFVMLMADAGTAGSKAKRNALRAYVRPATPASRTTRHVRTRRRQPHPHRRPRRADCCMSATAHRTSTGDVHTHACADTASGPSA